MIHEAESALLAAPAIVGLVGAVVGKYGLRRFKQDNDQQALLLTYGVSYLLVQVVILIWGLKAKFYFFPRLLDGPLFSLYGTAFPKYRVFIMLAAILMLFFIHLLLSRTRIGLVVQASLTHPHMVEALGHDVPLTRTVVFGGGAALAALERFRVDLLVDPGPIASGTALRLLAMAPPCRVATSCPGDNPPRPRLSRSTRNRSSRSDRRHGARHVAVHGAFRRKRDVRGRRVESAVLLVH
ncbi:branched-chain amino acid ABC transporter permease [Noviherbaspirillum malthae]|uniref:branched-chain amino acid ABC transporter permease n=1 Tax=Noviherbaspirillum malthae TaxID=1260987 RepID=UPI00188F46FE|nr:hypothetical protein [Noviherbaspirillum malthae]